MIRTELGLVLAFSLVGSAFAASPEVDARAAAEDARQAFATGDFERAIERFEDAWRKKPAPGLLFNLGQSHRRAGHVALAGSFFRRYLETNPAPTQAAVASALLRELELEPSGLLPPPMPPLEAEPLWLPSTPTEFTLHPSPPPLLVTRWWFWTLVGAAAAGGAVALGVSLAPHPAPTSLSPIDAR